MDKKTKKEISVLVVDDIKQNRDILCNAFKNEYIIYEAENGEEALKIVKSKSVDAVFLDLMMPVLDGYGVIKAMQSDEKLSEIPILVITSVEDEESQVKALDMGAIDVINKPFNPQLVRSRTKNAIFRHFAQEQKRESELLEYKIEAQRIELEKSRYDNLTGLYTKQYFFTQVDNEIKNNVNKKYGIIRFDISRFNVFNDAFGMKEGDNLLKFFAEKLTRNKIGIFTARFESDQFAVFFEKGSIKYDELIKTTTSWFVNYPCKFNFIIKAGIYLIDDINLDISVMCDRALFALREIKLNSDLMYCEYDESLRKTLLDEEALLSDIESAYKNEEFVVWYQPQYDYSTGRMSGAEALVRWNHPTLGLLLPAKFIPLMEKNGIMLRLDEYVWEHCCKDLRKWIDEHQDKSKLPPISVNIARTDFLKVDLTTVFSELTKKYNIPHSMLNLEITESAYMEDSEQLLETVKNLKDMGFTIEMDDFGSGYSSLNTLKDVPVDILKLDMRFVAGAQDSSKSGSILSSVVRMAHWLNLAVIAEGIETREQADYIKSIGCRFMQGFLFSKPVAKEVFESIYKKAGTKDEEALNKKPNNAEPFWSVANQTALIFNSFLGGAMICEYQNGNLEMLRANDKFFEVIKTSRKDYEPWVTHIQDRIDYNYKIKLFLKFSEAEISDEESALEICTVPDYKGEVRWYFCRIKILAVQGESSIFYMGIDDITEAKNSESQNKNNTILLRSLYDTVPSGIVRFKLINGQEKELVSYNELSLKYLNFENEVDFLAAVKNSDIFQNIMPESKNKGKEAYEKLISSEDEASTSFEYEILLPDGSISCVYAIAQLIVAQNEKCLQIVLNDYSPLKTREARKYGESLLAFFEEVFEVDFNNLTFKSISGEGQPIGETKNLDEVLHERVSKVINKREAEELKKRFAYIKATHPRKVSELPKLNYTIKLDSGKKIKRTLVLVFVEDGKYLCCITNLK